MKCKLCEDNGFVLFKQKHEDAKYDFAAYCHKCEKGNGFKYYGKEYYINSISAYPGLADKVLSEYYSNVWKMQKGASE